jgi:2-polyprenyl-3-methyl-5-hydroxy-6-metoxy-1,4-benzoquinol methylase
LPRHSPRASLNLPQASAGREQFLDAAARAREIVPKEDFVLERCRDRQVLDIGCINHSADNALALGDAWLHARIRGVAASVVGLDVLEADSAALNERGYDIVVGDAQDFQLDRTFDVVVAADVIEHLTDIGSFLRSVRRHLHAGSELVLTTPNPFSFAQMMQVLLRGRAVVNAQHTVWLDPAVLYALLDREGYEIADLQWIDSDPHYRHETVPTRLLERAATLVGRRRPLCNANYAVVARVASAG